MRLLSAIAALLVAALCVVPAQAKTLTVGSGMTYETIDAALEDAKAKDTISVAEGVYDVSDGIEIEIKGLVLKGAGADRCILDGQGEAYSVVKANAEDVTVTGFCLRNGSSHGVYVNGENSAVITYNVISANGDRGILLGMGEPTAVIDHNTFANNKISAIYSYRDDAKIKFTNNIVYENGRSIVTDSTMSHMTVKYNCFYGQSNDDEAAKTSKTNLEKDPLFVDSDEDFHLQAGSPCLGKGDKGTNPAIEQAKSTSTGGKYRVVVFSDDEELGNKVLDMMKIAGFANDESYVSDEPNDEANIKYGAADKDDVKKMRGLISAVYDDKLDLSDEFEEDDYDVFINLP